MNEGRGLYQELIIDHGRRPRNRGQLECPTHFCEGKNPLCGDHLTLQLSLVGDQIQEVRFEGAGCAISMASASLMTQAVKGHSVKEALALGEAFRAMLVSADHSTETLEKLGKLSVFQGVCAYPARVKCATLAWHTLEGALQKQAGQVSTED